MATNVIMPALEMAQDSGKILRWLKAEGAPVTKGDPIMEIETDKVTVEIEAPASGTLANVTAREGDVIPVGQTITPILAPGESILSGAQAQSQDVVTASPVARKIAEEQHIDLSRVKPQGGRAEKVDVLAYLQTYPPTPPSLIGKEAGGLRRISASPKARRLATERGVDIATLRGSGLDGAVIAADIPAAPITQSPTLPTAWRVMAERMTKSWTTAPHPRQCAHTCSKSAWTVRCV